MISRHFAGLGLLCSLVTNAFAQCTQDCPPLKLIPISGHVYDASTGEPIAGAVVHFFEPSPHHDRQGRLRVQAIQGVVRTAPDGSYTLPANLPLSDYRVRASAPGYLSSTYLDEPAVIDPPWARNFLPRPDHDLRLEPSRGLIAIGSSLLGGAQPPAMLPDVTAGAFADDRSSFVFALRGPSLWLVSLPAGTVRSIPLPSAVAGSAATISALAWDGHQLLFLAADPTGEHRILGGGAAPGFQIALLPTPNTFTTGINIGPATFGPSRFLFHKTSACDEDQAPHCGHTAALVAQDRFTNRTLTLKTGAVFDLSYLFDPLLHTVLLSVPVDVSGTAHTQQQTAPPFTQRLAAIDLVSGNRAFLDLPGQGSSTIDLIAERRIESQGQRHGQGQGRFAGYLTAYTTTGDCDPASTDAAQPFAPTDRAGRTPNPWSLCIIATPAPAAPTHASPSPPWSK